jgi:hypothetical protein
MKTVISQLTTLPHLIPILDPKASNCSDIWKANSLVGVKINAYLYFTIYRSMLFFPEKCFNLSVFRKAEHAQQYTPT